MIPGNEELDLLLNRYFVYTAPLSGSYERHPLFKEVVAHGEAAMPRLFFYLMWGQVGASAMSLMRAISGENPVPAQHAGRIPIMKAYWIVWGDKKGYLKGC